MGLFSVFLSVFIMAPFSYAQTNRVYMSGPLFNMSERAVMLALDASVRKVPNFETFLPQKDGVEANIQRNINSSMKVFPSWFSQAVFAKDFLEIYYSQSIVANIDGQLIDDGVAVELGIGYSLGKPIYLFSSDRSKYIPPMVAGVLSGNKVASNLKELIKVLESSALSDRQPKAHLERKFLPSSKIFLTGPNQTISEKVQLEYIKGLLMNHLGKEAEIITMDRGEGAFQSNLDNILSSQMVVAVVNGVAPQPETSIEIGLAFGAKVPVILFHGDDRTLFNGSLNAMVSQASQFEPAYSFDKLLEFVDYGFSTFVDHDKVLSQAQRKRVLDKLGHILPILRPIPPSADDKALANSILKSEGIDAVVE